MAREIKRRGKDTKPRTRRLGAYKGIILNGKYFEIYLPTHPNATGSKKLYFPLHRLVMEWKMGRKLVEGEVVHHIDGDTLNNNPNNLELLGVSEHNRITYQNRKKDKYGKLI